MVKTIEWTFCEESILSLFHMPHQTSGLSPTVEWRGKKEEAVTPPLSSLRSGIQGYVASWRRDSAMTCKSNTHKRCQTRSVLGITTPTKPRR
jgi:hypothetical protein